MRYDRSELSKSELYLEGLPVFTRGAVTIPDYPPLLRELRLLERSTSRQGKDTVGHGRGANEHDDLANALFGCMFSIGGRKTSLQIWEQFGAKPMFEPGQDPGPRGQGPAVVGSWSSGDSLQQDLERRKQAARENADRLKKMVKL
jgi:hypothetical protein